MGAGSASLDGGLIAFTLLQDCLRYNPPRAGEGAQFGIGHPELLLDYIRGSLGHFLSLKCSGLRPLTSRDCLRDCHPQAGASGTESPELELGEAWLRGSRLGASMAVRPSSGPAPSE